MITHEKYLELNRKRPADRTEQEQAQWQEYHNEVLAAKEREKAYMRSLRNYKPQPDRFATGLWNLAHINNLVEYLRSEYIRNVEARGCVYVKDTYTEQAITDVCRWLQKRPKVGLILRGYVGVGKSLMLTAIKDTLSQTIGKVVTIVSANDIAADARNDSEQYETLKKKRFLGRESVF